MLKTKEICTDAPTTSKDYSFYSQFKPCHNVTHECLLSSKNSTTDSKSKRNNRDDDETSEFFLENAYSIKNGPIGEQQPVCYNKLTKGPIFIRHKNVIDEQSVKSASNSFFKFTYYLLCLLSFCFVFA